ncbi:hypothetical protein AA18889_1127 [Acetobacter senegalensis DSM 18889]|nr:hypothetical protein AA18889_1127 [Acetobacter senegalensis DSM 18889]
MPGQPQNAIYQQLAAYHYKKAAQTYTHNSMQNGIETAPCHCCRNGHKPEKSKKNRKLLQGPSSVCPAHPRPFAMW